MKVDLETKKNYRVVSGCKSLQRFSEALIMLHKSCSIKEGDVVVIDNGISLEYDGNAFIVLEKETSNELPLGFMSTFKKPYKYKTDKSINNKKKNSLYKNKGRANYGR